MRTIKGVYFYTISLSTVGIFAAGGHMLLRLGLDIIIKGPTLIQMETPGFIREQLSLGLALLVIGGALWFLFWRAVQRQVSESPAEVGAAIRKLFLNIFLAAAALVGLYMAVGFLRWLMAGVQLAQFASCGLDTSIVAGALCSCCWGGV